MKNAQIHITNQQIHTNGNGRVAGGVWLHPQQSAPLQQSYDRAKNYSDAFRNLGSENRSTSRFVARILFKDGNKISRYSNDVIHNDLSTGTLVTCDRIALNRLVAMMKKYFHNKFRSVLFVYLPDDKPFAVLHPDYSVDFYIDKKSGEMIQYRFESKPAGGYAIELF